MRMATGEAPREDSGVSNRFADDGSDCEMACGRRSEERRDAGGDPYIGSSIKAKQLRCNHVTYLGCIVHPTLSTS